MSPRVYTTQRTSSVGGGSGGGCRKLAALHVPASVYYAGGGRRGGCESARSAEATDASWRQGLRNRGRREAPASARTLRCTASPSPSSILRPLRSIHSWGLCDSQNHDINTQYFLTSYSLGSVPSVVYTREDPIASQLDGTAPTTLVDHRLTLVSPTRAAYICSPNRQ
jgi:hypothetical protein